MRWLNPNARFQNSYYYFWKDDRGYSYLFTNSQAEVARKRFNREIEEGSCFDLLETKEVKSLKAIIKEINCVNKGLIGTNEIKSKEIRGLREEAEVACRNNENLKERLEKFFNLGFIERFKYAFTGRFNKV